MATTTVNAASTAAPSRFNFSDAGDIQALASALRSSVRDKFTESLQETVRSLNTHVTQLKQLDEVSKRLGQVSAIDGAVPTVRLGADIQSSTALKDAIEDAGFALTTSFRNEIMIEVSTNGGAAATAWHIATEAELASAKAAPLKSADAFIEQHRTISANSSTTYFIALQSGVHTAKAADINLLKTAIPSQQQALRTVIESESAWVKSSLALARKNEEKDDQSFGVARQGDADATSHREENRRIEGEEILRKRAAELERAKAQQRARNDRDE
jgi:hypothetical protein